MPCGCISEICRCGDIRTFVQGVGNSGTVDLGEWFERAHHSRHPELVLVFRSMELDCERTVPPLAVDDPG